MARPPPDVMRPRPASQSVKELEKCSKKLSISQQPRKVFERFPLPPVPLNPIATTPLHPLPPWAHKEDQDEFNSWLDSIRSGHHKHQHGQDRLVAPRPAVARVKDVIKQDKRRRRDIDIGIKREQKMMIVTDEEKDNVKKPWFRHPLHLQDTRRMQHSGMAKKKKVERGPSSFREIFGEEGSGCIQRMECNPDIKEIEVDKMDALELRPILSSEDAKVIQRALKDYKSRLRPYTTKASRPIDEDPLWEKWELEDNGKLKNRRSRARPPFFPINESELRGPASFEEIHVVVENAVPELSGPVEYHAEYGGLNSVLLEKDPLDMAVLMVMDPPVYHAVPKSQKNVLGRSREGYGKEQRRPVLSRAQIYEMEAERDAAYNEQRVQERSYGRPQTYRCQVPAVYGPYDYTPRSYSDYLKDDSHHDPWFDKLRGLGQLSSQLDWGSFLIEQPERYHHQAANCDTEQHRRRYGPLTDKHLAANGTRHIAPSRRIVPPVDKRSHSTRAPRSQSPTSKTSTKRKYQDGPSQSDRAVAIKKIDPRLDMGALRDIVLIPEAKIDHKKIRTIGPMATAHELTSFFSDLTNPPTAPGPIQKITTRPKNSKTDPESRKSTNDGEWRKHKSIQNPKWYGSSIRLSASRPHLSSEGGDTPTPIPIIIAAPILQNRPLYRALEEINFVPVEKEGVHIQHVDLILAPSTGLIFHPLAKLASNHAKLLQRLKSAAFYFQRVVLVLEVVPYRRFKDPASVAEVVPIDEGVVKALSAFKRGLEVGVNSQEGLVGSAEIVFALNGAGEVASMLRGLSIKLDSETSKGCHGDILETWQDKSWMYKEVDPVQEEYLVSAGFNAYSTAFILHLYGSFSGFAEGLSDKERLERIGPIAGLQVVKRFNAKWWRRQVESRRKIDQVPATSETVLGSG